MLLFYRGSSFYNHPSYLLPQDGWQGTCTSMSLFNCNRNLQGVLPSFLVEEIGSWRSYDLIKVQQQGTPRRHSKPGLLVWTPGSMLFPLPFAFFPIRDQGTPEYHLVPFPCATKEKLKPREGKGLAQVTRDIGTDSSPHCQVCVSAWFLQETSSAPPRLGDHNADWIFALTSERPIQKQLVPRKPITVLLAKPLFEIVSNHSPHWRGTGILGSPICAE